MMEDARLAVKHDDGDNKEAIRFARQFLATRCSSVQSHSFRVESWRVWFYRDVASRMRG